MATKDKEAEEVLPPVVEIEATPTVKVKKDEAIKMSIEQYFENERKDIHPYTQAFISSDYRGILKSKDEWNTVIKESLGN